jgi:hypothetical protein
MARERGALTTWKTQIDGHVSTWKESERERGTHCLESAERWTSEDTERNRTSEGHSRAGELRVMDK